MAGDGGDGSGNLGTEPKPPGRAETAGRWLKPPIVDRTALVHMRGAVSDSLGTVAVRLLVASQNTLLGMTGLLSKR